MNLDRILSRCIEDGDCLIWQGGFVRGRWPRMYARIDGKETQVSVRPVVWKLSGGRDIKPGEVVAMNCGCDACLEKSHMELIDKGEVSRRNWKKPGARLLRAVKNQRSSHGKAKLDMEKARELRARFDAGETQVALAAEFQISQSLASRVARGESWKEYGGNPFAALLVANDSARRAA